MEVTAGERVASESTACPHASPPAWLGPDVLRYSIDPEGAGRERAAAAAAAAATATLLLESTNAGAAAAAAACCRRNIIVRTSLLTIFLVAFLI